MLFIARSPVLFVRFQCSAKAVAAKLARVSNISLPGRWPAGSLDKAAGLTERKINSCNPRPGLRQSCVERVKVRPLLKGLREQMISL